MIKDESKKLLPIFTVILFLILPYTALTQSLDESIHLSINESEVIEVQQRNINTAIIIDGKIDEAVWTSITPYERLKVTQPDTLKDPIYKSVVKFFYTVDGFYFSIDMEQPKDTLVKRFTNRDDWATKSDKVSISIDTSGEAKYAYWMALSLGDSEGDGTLLPEKRYSMDWDGAWNGATSETDNGWSAEFYIPWSQMAMPKKTNDRIINLYTIREVAHLEEEWAWPALPDSIPQFLSLFQPMKLNNVNLKQQWSIFPYVSMTQDRIDNKSNYQTGADFFWRPSTNAQVTATIKPDFGAVESDNVVVNLTANETFFPEKRLFFQEGSEVFNATPRSGRGGGRNRFTVINTRRIGSAPSLPELPDGVSISTRDEEITKADLIGAFKTTGQFNKFRYGVLTAFEEDTNYRANDNNIYSQTGRDFGALRLLYEDSENGSTKGIGILSTIVTKPTSNSIVHAMDYHYLTESGAIKIDGQYINSDTANSGSGKGGYTDISYTPERGKKHNLKLSIFDKKLQVNDFGFNQRNNIRDIQYNNNYINSNSSRYKNRVIRNWFRYGENLYGQQITGGFGSGLTVLLNNLHEIQTGFAYFPARYEDRNSFGNGTYKINQRNRFEFQYSTNKSKKITFEGKISYQDENLYGEKITSELELLWYLKSNLSLKAEIQYVDANGWLLHQEGKDFTTFNAQKWQPEFKVNYFINAKQQLSLNFQWVGIQAIEEKFYLLNSDSLNLDEVFKPDDINDSDNFSISQLNIQLRYRWQIAPLSDFYIVATKTGSSRSMLTSFNELYEDIMDNPMSDQIIMKLRYRFGS